MAHQQTLSLPRPLAPAVGPGARRHAWLHGLRGLCALLAVALALMQLASLALANKGSSADAKDRLAGYVPWIEKTLHLGTRGGVAGEDTAAEYARYYAWSKSNPGDVRVVRLRDPGRAGIHIVEVDDIPRSAAGACDMAARVDVVRRRVMEVGCNPGA